jgi:hypothetical protein
MPKFCDKSYTIFLNSMRTQNGVLRHFYLIFLWNKTQKYISKKFANLIVRAFLVCAILLLFASKTACWWNLTVYFSRKVWELKMVALQIFNWSFDTTKQKTFPIKICSFGFYSCLSSAMLLLFAPKQPILTTYISKHGISKWSYMTF